MPTVVMRILKPTNYQLSFLQPAWLCYNGCVKSYKAAWLDENQMIVWRFGTAIAKLHLFTTLWVNRVSLDITCMYVPTFCKLHLLWLSHLASISRLFYLVLKTDCHYCLCNKSVGVHSSWQWLLRFCSVNLIYNIKFRFLFPSYIRIYYYVFGIQFFCMYCFMFPSNLIANY